MKKEYLIYKLSEEMKEATRIDNELFPKFDVKRGLRNEDGTGVLVGLTKIGNVVGYERIPGGPYTGQTGYPHGEAPSPQWCPAPPGGSTLWSPFSPPASG